MQQEPSGGDGSVRVGQRAEAVAALWLEGRGCAILDRNRRGGAGEIDLVARDGDTLVFVEVRSRRRGSWVGAAASIGFDKRRRLRSCARSLLERREDFVWPGRRIRFDVITLEYDSRGFDLRHLVQVRI